MITTKQTERTPLLLDVPAAGPFATAPQLLPGSNDDEEATTPPPSILQPPSVPVTTIVLVLLIGVMVSNADASFVTATHTVIASEFGALHDSSWLLTGFVLASAVTQPLYGKLSDIYGRKMLLLVAYFLFAAGCALVGIGTSMSYVILGRVISGLGSSGMTALVSILVTDLLPLRSVASWRSYINIVATTSRSIGGPLGGWLADTVGWRWSFIGQVPIVTIAIALVAAILPAHTQRGEMGEDEEKQSKLSRIDFLGAMFLTLTLLGFLMPLQIGGDRMPWSHPLILGLLGSAVAFSALFFATEKWFAKEPIIPPSLLLQRDMVLSIIIMVTQAAAQVGLTIAIPLYFQITVSASSGEAGAHIVPGAVGNAVGGLVSGSIIKRTGRYKTLTLLALLFAIVGYTLLIVRWDADHPINFFESLYNFPGGFAMGIVNSTLFIAIQASLAHSGKAEQHSAVAASTLYLAGLVGTLAGMAGTSAVLQGCLRSALERRLETIGVGGAESVKIIERAVSDLKYARRAPEAIARIVVRSYIEALSYTHVFALACCVAALAATVLLREYRL